MPVTIGMKGGGYYDDHSAPQMASIEAVLPRLEEAVGAANLQTQGRPIIVADFACSEGRNSIAASKRIIAALRRWHRGSIQTVHSDLPTNNFNQLFTNLYPAGRSVFADPDVFSAAVGGSMYDQLLPTDTVTVATTFNAIGFLNERPAVSIPDYILPMGPARPRPGVNVDAAARQAYAAQASEDLARFYTARAAELVPGGKLLVASFGVGEEHRACDGLYDVLSDALLDLVASGRLSREWYERLLFPIYFRSAAELVEPVAGSHSGLAKLFRLDRVESMEVPVPFNDRLELTGDVRAYATEFTRFLQAFTEPIIRMTFHNEPELDSQLVDLYSVAESRLAADPAAYAFHYIQVAALLTKI